MPVSTYSADYQLGQWAANHGLYMSLHGAYSATGGSELTGGSPAYARVADGWGSPAGNSISLASTYTFNVPASSTVAFIGFWDSLTGGNFQGMYPNSGSASAYAFSAPSSTSTVLAPGTSYAANQSVVVFPTAQGTLPGGLTAGVIYYVKSPSGDSFELSATSGGAAITLTADGGGLVQVITPVAYPSQGTFQVTQGTLNYI
jgi:hypothetical protein